MYAEAWQYELPAPSAPAKSSSSSAILKGHYDPDGEWPQNVKCHACRSAVFQEVPEGWKNKRGNTSVVVRKKDANGNWKNILVDCGKTFIEQTRRFFPRWGVQSIDAVLITHGRELSLSVLTFVVGEAKAVRNRRRRLPRPGRSPRVVHEDEPTDTHLHGSANLRLCC